MNRITLDTPFISAGLFLCYVGEVHPHMDHVTCLLLELLRTATFPHGLLHSFQLFTPVEYLSERSCALFPVHRPKNVSKIRLISSRREPASSCRHLQQSFTEVVVLACTSANRPHSSHCKLSIYSDLKSCHFDGYEKKKKAFTFESN